MPLDTSTYSLALLRLDGRRWNELRRINAQISTQAAADGSSYLEMGNTKVICTVSGPSEGRKGATAGGAGGSTSGDAVVEVELSVAGFAGVERKRAGRGDKRISEMQTTIASAFTQTLFTHLYPHSTISLSLHVLSSDGSLLAACLNACTLALVDAGIPMSDYIVACTAGSTSSSSSSTATTDEGTPDPLLDLNLVEEGELPFLTVATVGAGEKVVVCVLETRVLLSSVEGMLAVGVDGCKQDIEAIYTSGDAAALRDLNSLRRTAGEKVISSLLKTINSDALGARAETLRDGIKCTVYLPSADQAYFNSDVLGGCNYHGSLVFEDGKTWLARFRLPNHNEPPLQERNSDRRSEFATYCFLARTAVPVPEVYDCADDDDPLNLVGAGKQKENFSRQLADIFADLEQHPLNGLGRLQLSSTGGLPEAGPAFFDYDSSSGNVIPFGPFSHSNAYYTALIQQKIQLLRTGEMGSSAPLDLYLVYKSLLDALPPNEPGPFFLRHVDSRDANFLVDGDYTITGIIDWELAISTSKSSAFQSPLLLYDLGDLYHQALSTPSEDEKRLSSILREEKGAVELSALAAHKLHFRVEQVIETDPWDRHTLVSLFGGWWKVARGVETFEWETWYQWARDRYGDGGFAASISQGQARQDGQRLSDG
ncbi:MAG: hypothetical protein M1819_006600 [Sarea resinae]|nr:MAG: hypothetical protein M1819_006600 [Sarea resinae]